MKNSGNRAEIQTFIWGKDSLLFNITREFLFPQLIFEQTSTNLSGINPIPLVFGGMHECPVDGIELGHEAIFVSRIPVMTDLRRNRLACS